MGRATDRSMPSRRTAWFALLVCWRLGAVIALAACGDDSGPDADNPCRAADKFLDGCKDTLGVSGGDFADDNYQCRSRKSECQAECVLEFSKSCDEYIAHLGVNVSTPGSPVAMMLGNGDVVKCKARCE